MTVTVPAMKLQELFEEYGIHSMLELRQQTGLSKQYAWVLWHNRANVGHRLAERLSVQLGIPYERLLTVERGAPPKKKSDRPPGRPRKDRGTQPS